MHRSLQLFFCRWTVMAPAPLNQLAHCDACTLACPLQVAQLRQQNRDLRVQVVLAAAAPADPHAGRLDGQLLRRTRTTPL